jgi:transcriptional regulator with XRE-family HTH domain
LRGRSAWGESQVADVDQSRPKTLAEKLNLLFQTVHPRNRGEYSAEEVAQAIEEMGGPTISPSYIWYLRTGRRDNPTRKHLEALARFFGVSPAYFLDDEAAERIDAQLDLLAALRDAGVREIALRASGLSPLSLDAIREMINHVRQLEGIPDGRDEPPPEEEGT